MAYQHDVFISYKREALWTPWVRDHFKKLLHCYLQQELMRAPDIFVDERIIVGADWVDELGLHLASSRVVVAIFSGDYFASDWCVHELDLIVQRCARTYHLIIPTVVHDGEYIPDPVKRLQPLDLSKYRIACMYEHTSDYHDFSKAIRALAPAVRDAINRAPPFQPNWITEHQQRFNDVYQASLGSPPVAPSSFTLNRPSAPSAPPRLRP
jgi:hypothetical protein